VLKNSTKYLGIMLDYKLNWHEHIDLVSKKMASGCFLIKRIMQICNFNTAKLVYHSYVHSRIAYGILLWGHSNHTKRPFILQKRAIRYLAAANFNPCTAGTYFKDSCRPLFIEFGILTLPCLYIFSAILYVIDNKNQTIELNKIHEHSTRNNCILKIDKYSSTFSEKSPMANGKCFYNKLLTDCKLSFVKNNTLSFKTNVKNFLIKNAFYSIKEFLNFKLKHDNM
jgi:hypothetical protein